MLYDPGFNSIFVIGVENGSWVTLLLSFFFLLFFFDKQDNARLLELYSGIAHNPRYM